MVPLLAVHDTEFPTEIFPLILHVILPLSDALQLPETNSQFPPVKLVEHILELAGNWSHVLAYFAWQVVYDESFVVLYTIGPEVILDE